MEADELSGREMAQSGQAAGGGERPGVLLQRVRARVKRRNSALQGGNSRLDRVDLREHWR